jgi:hypothetical protein
MIWPDSPSRSIRPCLSQPGRLVRIPGTHNGMAALQAKAAGFEALYLSGAAMTASMGLPDLGIITIDEVSFFIRQIARASGLPVLVDGDTGHSEALNVMHMVRSFEDAGAAAVHIEDQLQPKKCGHLNDKKLADARDMLEPTPPRAKDLKAPSHARSSTSKPAPMRSFPRRIPSCWQAGVHLGSGERIHGTYWRQSAAALPSSAPMSLKRWDTAWSSGQFPRCVWQTKRKRNSMPLFAATAEQVRCSTKCKLGRHSMV